MIRYLRVSGVVSDEARVTYYANKPRFISAAKMGDKDTSATAWARIPVVIGESIILNVPPLAKADGLYYEVKLDVSENQPTAESVKEVTSHGVAIGVFNEYGVKICDNGVTVPSTPASGTTNAPGEMTSVPGTEPGEMTTAPSPEPGEMI